MHVFAPPLFCADKESADEPSLLPENLFTFQIQYPEKYWGAGERAGILQKPNALRTSKSSASSPARETSSERRAYVRANFERPSPILRANLARPSPTGRARAWACERVCEMSVRARERECVPRTALRARNECAPRERGCEPRTRVRSANTSPLREQRSLRETSVRTENASHGCEHCLHCEMRVRTENACPKGKRRSPRGTRVRTENVRTHRERGPRLRTAFTARTYVHGREHRLHSGRAFADRAERPDPKRASGPGTPFTGCEHCLHAGRLFIVKTLQFDCKSCFVVQRKNYTTLHFF